MSRSLLRQLEQIRRSATYDDVISGVYTSAVAEPVVSGSLEQDMNVVRTLVKDLKGTSDWYGDLGTYFDPTDTTSGSVSNKVLSLDNIRNNTLDAKTALLAVADDNSGAGYTVVSGTDGVLLDVTTVYATADDRRGLPIFASTAHAGSYWDEGGVDRTVRVDILDTATGNEFQDDSGYTIYGKLYDGADAPTGSGTGTDVYVRLFANDAEITDLGTSMAAPPTEISVIYPYRKTLDSILEHEWTRTTFVSSWEGDVELVEDIQNLWAFTGATDNDGSPQPWSNATGNYMLASDPDSLASAVDILNDEAGSRDYSGTAQTYITTGESITASLIGLEDGMVSNDTDISTNSTDIGDNYDDIVINAGNITTNSNNITTNASGIAGNDADILDLQQLTGATTLAGVDYANNNYVTDGTSLETAIGTLDDELNRVEDLLDATSGLKYVESVSVLIDKNVEHVMPGFTYTPKSTAGMEGGNMDVYVDGQLLAADTGAAGVNADRDYAETTTSGLTFRFKIQVGRNITYIVKQ